MEHVTADLVVVGAGAAGLLAAAAARRLGDEVIIVESSRRAGGTATEGNGLAWLPGNRLAAKGSAPDSTEEVEQYLASVLGEPGDEQLAARRAAFVRTAPKVSRWLVSSHVPLHAAKTIGDDHLDLPGAKTGGRVVQSGPIDRRVLGETEAALVRTSGVVREALSWLPLPRNTATGGESLVAHLLHRAVANGVSLWLESTITSLITDGDRVTGVTVDRDGVPTQITAGRVLLASGGFAADQALREEYLPLPTDATWTTAAAGNHGELLKLATGIGAATTNLSAAWWMPVMISEGRASSVRTALDGPHSMLVDAAGDRYIDETRSDDDLGQLMYDHSRGVRAVPSFLIMDNRHRASTPLGLWAPGSTPRRAIEDGEITRANTLNDLAQATGLDRAGLLGSVVRFNNFAAKGTDSDFHRGRPEATGKAKRRNPSLGKIDKPPFWAVKVYPGDAGTKGGLVTDASARVLRADGSTIGGLYACPGTAASIFATGSPSVGASLGESLVAAFLAVTDQRS